MLSSNSYAVSGPWRANEPVLGGLLDEGPTHDIVCSMSWKRPGEPKRPWSPSRAAATCLALILVAAAAWGAPIHTTYLWHMHQPIYWPDDSTWSPGEYEQAYETIVLGHSENDEADIFGKADRLGDYQYYPRDAIASILDLPDAGAQVSFAGSLIENITSLGDNGWNGGAYAPNWWQAYRDARGWTTSGGRTRCDMVLVGHHHAINPLMDENAFRSGRSLPSGVYFCRLATRTRSTARKIVLLR